MKRLTLNFQVPGTSANMGSGFDILGIALKIYNQFQLEFHDKATYHSRLMNGNPLPFSDKEDLFLKSYKQYFSIFLPEVEPIPYDIKMNLGLPLKGGLGSSASAVAGGFYTGYSIHHKLIRTQLPDKEKFIYELAMAEGHPDNTIPALLGGVVFSFFSGKTKLIQIRKKFPKSIQLILFIPKFEIETAKARKILPESYPLQDVIFNSARTGAWLEFLHSGKQIYLQEALQDRVHTSYRINSNSILKEIAGSLTAKFPKVYYSLSGSGPSLLLYTERKHAKKQFLQLRENIDAIMKKHATAFSLTMVDPDYAGIKGFTKL